MRGIMHVRAQWILMPLLFQAGQHCWRRWNSHWRRSLKFRESAQHAQCNICHKYSSFLHMSASTAEEKRQAAKEWRVHLSGQYHDRLIYWHLRWFSRLRTKGVLQIIIDSMDKGKVAWPQYGHRTPKSLDKHVRPRLVITCAIAHGLVSISLWRMTMCCLMAHLPFVRY